LRDRTEDIPILVEAFVQEACERNGFALKKVSPAALQGLAAMEWGGNVRELKNYVERLAILTPGAVIERADIGAGGGQRKGEVDDIMMSSKSLQEFKDHAEAAFIRHQLEKHHWNVSKTAEALEMERSHLYTKIKKYGLSRGDGGPPEEE
jgi:DNA-binding NtrC family response regulator